MIAAANNLSEASTIVFKNNDGTQLFGPIGLPQELPHLQKDITIDGGQTITVHRGPFFLPGDPPPPPPKFRIFTVDAGSTSKLLGLGISNGEVTDNGGGVANFGTLEIEKCSIGNNKAEGNGGGVYNAPNCTISLKDTIIGENEAANGGGVYSDQNALIQVSGCFFGVNKAVGKGGGMYAELSTGSTLGVQDTTFLGNEATGPDGEGGGLYVDGSPTTSDCLILGSEFRDNRAKRGGGVWSGVNTEIQRTRFETNTATIAGGGVYHAGPGDLVVDFDSNFVDNEAPAGSGDGILFILAGGDLVVNADMGNDSVDVWGP
jgi:hypothetical protein